MEIVKKLQKQANELRKLSGIPEKDYDELEHEEIMSSDCLEDAFAKADLDNNEAKINYDI